jgi:predicted NBD/HSP70 family sugar kinase
MPVRQSGQKTGSEHDRRASQRLILQCLRRGGEASRADLARASGLTNTAIGGIIKQLDEAGLVRATGKRHAGQRGQPATMLGLDPRGAFALGVRLDRSRIETVITDLAGGILGQRMHVQTLPAPDHTLMIVSEDIDALVRLIPPHRRQRIVGVGVARPYGLGSWLTELDPPRDVSAPWDPIEFAAALERRCGLPVLEENDGNAAAIAELFHGHGRTLDNFLFVFIGPAIGGGIVLNGSCLRGATRNAGDLGVIPVPASRLDSAPRRPGNDILLGRASLNALARHLRFRGIADRSLEDMPAGGDGEKAVLEWLDDCVDALIQPLLAVRALLDVSTAVIDSDLPPAWIERLIARAGLALAAAAAEARTPPLLVRGSFGTMAGALGAATVPLFLNFGPGASRRNGRARDSTGGAHALVA